MGKLEARSPVPLPETRSPMLFLYRRRPSGEIRNLASVSSSLLPAFGTVMGEGSAQLRTFVIAPYDRRYRVWQVFLVILVVYSAWSSPFELAFRKVAMGSFQPVDLVVDAFFGVDIILTFFVAYLDKSTYLLVDDHKKIALRYVTHLGFPMDIASTIPFQTIYGLITGKVHRGQVFSFLNLLRLWRLHRVSAFFSRLEKDTRFSYFWSRTFKLICICTRDAINNILRYASKNRLPEGLKEQMLAHMTLKFKTAELQQQVLEDLPKAIRSAIAQHLFCSTLENTYLFKGVSKDFILQLVSELKAEYFPPKVDIIIQNEIPTDFYVIVSGAVDVLAYKNGTEQFLSKLGPPEMAGELGVIFNIPQPFTHLRGLRKEELEEIPMVTEFLGDPNNNEIIAEPEGPESKEGQNQQENRTFPTRVIMHGHHPHDELKEEHRGKLVHLPDSIQELFSIAEKRFGKKGTKVLMANGSEVEDIGALRENDHLYIC
nr:potassium channel KAT3-like isoform X2 [Ipomoea batatas]